MPFVRVNVDDAGPGLPPGMETRIFDKFHGAARRSRPSPVSGLGWRSAGAIVTAHGGTIGALNRVAADGPDRRRAFLVHLAGRDASPVPEAPETPDEDSNP